MSNLAFILVAFFPMVIWIGIIAAIITAVKGNFKRTSRPGQSADSRRKPAVNKAGRPQTSIRTSGNRPQMQKGLFDMDTGEKPAKPKMTFSLGKSFRNTDFDEYTARGRRKDVVTGYDRKISGGTSYRRAAGMQFSHTYDGHEPWDECLPKEKDPWDKDFYT